MIAKDHQCALIEFDVDPTGGVRQNQRSDPQQLEGSDGKGHLLQRVTFIIVNATLHCDDWYVLKCADYQLSGMALCRGADKTRNLFVRNFDGVLKIIRQRAETTAENQSHAWLVVGARANRSRRVFGTRIQI